jgi:hypothetical protein
MDESRTDFRCTQCVPRGSIVRHQGFDEPACAITFTGNITVALPIHAVISSNSSDYRWHAINYLALAGLSAFSTSYRARYHSCTITGFSSA